MVVAGLWPSRDASRGKAEKPSYFPLPALCAQALGRFSSSGAVSGGAVSGGAVSVSAVSVIAVNAAWALLYMASYLLDKIEDQEIDNPLFSSLGPGPVANLTTGLILHSERILAELEPGDGLDSAALDGLRRAFNRRALEVCAGQHLDLTASRDSLEGVWEIASGKSGKFFALGGHLGALAAGAQPAQVEAFSQFGLRLGILVQIANDLTGLVDTSARSDLALGKKTLPVVYALTVLPDAPRALLADQLAAAPGDESAEIDAKRAIISSGALVYLSLEADKHRQQARRILESLSLPAAQTAPLLGLLDHAIHTGDFYRKYHQANH